MAGWHPQLSESGRSNHSGGILNQDGRSASISLKYRHRVERLTPNCFASTPGDPGNTGPELSVHPRKPGGRELQNFYRKRMLLQRALRGHFCCRGQKNAGIRRNCSVRYCVVLRGRGWCPCKALLKNMKVFFCIFRF